MLYTPLTKRAMHLCVDAHEGQLDRSGLPYATHPFHLAEQMSTEEQTCVALLHDVIEDTDRTEEDMRAIGITDRMMGAIRLLTHEPGVTYFDYVRAIRDAYDADGDEGVGGLARTVKIADLRHNSQLERLDQVTDKDRSLHARYLKALHILGA